MNRTRFIGPVLIMLFSVNPGVSAQPDSIAFSGQVIGWAGMNVGKESITQLGGRFLPALFYQHTYKNK